MREELCFVQFIHPGGEHLPKKKAAGIPWNASSNPTKPAPAHKRKFLLRPGHFLRSLEQPKPDTANLTFWGEWEPQSEMVEDYGRGSSPRTLQKPYYVVPDSYVGKQNTDPFVFGDAFLYTGCLQNPQARNTQLCHLAPGSVILFGSPAPKKRQFILDTVFVVGNGPNRHRCSQDIARLGLQRTAYWDVTARPWYESAPEGGSCVQGEQFSLYRGAMFGGQRDGMFSFFPCLPHGERPNGFDRPAIDIDLISPLKPMGVRLNRGISQQEVSSNWRIVAEQVVGAGLCLGVYADVPEKRLRQPAA